MTDRLVGEKRKQQSEHNLNKQQCTGGTAAVNTHFGVNSFIAKSSLCRRNEVQSTKEKESKKKALDKEMKNIQKTLTGVDKRIGIFDMLQ